MTSEDQELGSKGDLGPRHPQRVGTEREQSGLGPEGNGFVEGFEPGTVCSQDPFAAMQMRLDLKVGLCHESSTTYLLSQERHMNSGKH